MATLWRDRRGRTALSFASGMIFVIAALLAAGRLPSGVAQDAVTAQPDQQYIGTRQCAACHFPQFRSWRGTTHQKAFEILPAKYRADAECLKCHATGAGSPSGFKDESMVDLAGVSCEACHGPGSEHAKIAQQAMLEELTPQIEQQIRDSTHRLEGNVCIQCHVTRAHKEHPAFDKE